MAQQNLLHRARIVYVPTVPQTIGGQAAVFYSPDPTVDTTLTGDSLVRHAGSYANKMIFQIADPCSFDLTPEDSNKRYFDQLSGEMRTSAEGIVQAISVTSIPDLNSSGGVAGTLWLEFDFEFYGFALANSIDDVPTGTITITAGTGTTGS